MKKEWKSPEVEILNVSQTKAGDDAAGEVDGPAIYIPTPGGGGFWVRPVGTLQSNQNNKQKNHSYEDGSFFC